MGIKINFTNVPKFKTVDEVQQYLISLQNQIQNYENLISHHIHKGGLNDFGQILSTYVSGLTDGSDASGYFKIGNMMIQWGTQVGSASNNGPAGGWYYSNYITVTYPVAFKAGTPPQLFISGCSSNSDWTMVYGLDGAGSNTAHTQIRQKTLQSYPSGLTFSWMAIGVWQ